LGAPRASGEGPHLLPRPRTVLIFYLVGLYIFLLGRAPVTVTPELYEEYFGADAGVPMVAERPPEPAAPLAFPPVLVEPGEITGATVEFAADGPSGPVVYRVTTHFESATSHTVIDRPDGVDLEVITAGDAALLRRTDEDVWYQGPRGDFPVAGDFERTQWVNSLAEVFPAEVRPQIAIDDATTSTVAGEAARRLVITVPNDQLPPPPVVPSLRGRPSTPPPPSAGAPAARPASPATDVPVRDVPARDATAARSSTTGVIASPPADAAPRRAVPTTTLEIWVDEQGLVRQIVGFDTAAANNPALDDRTAPSTAPVPAGGGLDRLTVVSTVTTLWVPPYPSPDQVQPLDADAVVHLGL
ncbi:MAG: hypothetical protein AAGG08_08040, partial [Actinomycetota bacterium]